MSSERKAQIITIAILTMAFGAVLAQKRGWKAGAVVQRAESAPQDAIYMMLDAARAGDVNRYLASYAGQMKSSLKQSRAETSDANFARYLKDSNASIKGIAIAEPVQLSDREVKIRVEYVYQDRNEAQYMYLERGPAGWKIARVDGAERVKTLVPYGTPVQ
jgi:hypothetical protein